MEKNQREQIEKQGSTALRDFLGTLGPKRRWNEA